MTSEQHRSIVLFSFFFPFERGHCKSLMKPQALETFLFSIQKFSMFSRCWFLVPNECWLKRLLLSSERFPGARLADFRMY